MSFKPDAEAALVRGLSAVVRALPPPAAVRLGSWLGDGVAALGIRAKVARANLTLAFPELDQAARDRILRAHYQELGRVACEYPRLPELINDRRCDPVAEVEGEEHLLALKALDMGAVVLTAHYGNFELCGAWATHWNPVDFVVKPLSNPGVDAWANAMRRRTGVGVIPLGPSIRNIYSAIKQKHWIALLADQDAGRDGVFVPFFGRLASTPRGPAELAVRLGIPVLMGFVERRPDGRHRFIATPAMWPRTDVEDPVWELTARHAAMLEARIRQRPELWFWLHRRWKTPPPDAATARHTEG